jgi:3-oxoadipate enol-lactonase
MQGEFIHVSFDYRDRPIFVISLPAGRNYDLPHPLIEEKANPTMTDLNFVVAGDGTRIAYRIDGEAGKPVLVLSNSIGTTLRMWDTQTEELSRHFRVLRYDMRGHGDSGVPAGAYSLDRLGRDVIELLDALGIARAHFLGLSLGGFVGQWLGVHAPERIDRLILSNTSPYLGPAAQWDERIAAVLQAPDMSGTAEIFLANWFPARMLAAKEPVVETFRAMLLATDRQGLAGSYAVVRDTDLRRIIALIDRPTLVIAGQHDTVTAASHGEQIAATVPGAKLVVLPAVHLSNIEYPVEFMQAVLGFLR